MWTRRNLPRSEWAKTSTKYSCFIVTPDRTPFWIRGDTLPRGSGGAYLKLLNYHWRISKCNSIYAACQSLQVLDNIDIISNCCGHAIAWNAFFAEFGGAPQPALPARTPRFPAALRGLGHRLDLGADSPAGSIGKLDVRIPGLPETIAPGRRE